MTFRRAAFSLIVLALIAGAIFVWVSIARLPLQPAYRTRATVTGITYGGRYRVYMAQVYFRSDGGLTGTVSFPVEQLGCAVGSTVPAIQQGLSIELAPGACLKSSVP